MVRVAVDGGGYAEACGGFYDADHDVVDTASALSGSLGSSGSMAGTDTGGEAWAAQYDPAARQAVQAGCDLATSLGTVANLLNVSLVNHDGADGGAMLAGPPEVTGQDTGDDNPNHYAEELSTPAPPSALGGTGDQPSWWHWIASHVEGLLWPDADTGRLRSAGQAWIKAGQALDFGKSEVDAATGLVAGQTSPEIKDAVAACQELSGHVGGLESAYASIGKACNDYADQVDSHRKEVEDELKSFIEWTIGIEAGGAVVGFFTAGLGEGAAQALEASKVAEAAAKVISILKRLIEVAKTVAEAIGEALETVAEIVSKLPKFLSPVIDRALVKLGVREAEEAGGDLVSQTDRVARHLSQFGDNPQNDAMIARIRQAAAEGRPLTEGEQNFMRHELVESDLMSKGMGYDEAHEIAMQEHPTFANYDPEVIKEYPDLFNDNWRKYWGIK